MALRAAHVFLTVWGGDTVHSLHMRRGSGILEVRPSGFARGAPLSVLAPDGVWASISCGAFFFVRGIVSFKGPTLIFFAFFAFFGQQMSKNGRDRRELDVPRRARNKMEVAICVGFVWRKLRTNEHK